MTKQYNFKITPELEAKVKKALDDSGLGAKSEFLEEMVTVYSSHLVNRESEVNIDMSAYKNISDNTKEVLEKTFNHLLSSMDYNYSSTLLEKVFIEKEKAALEEKSALLDQELDSVKLQHVEELKAVEERAKDELEALIEERNNLSNRLEEERILSVKMKEELKSLALIAEQTSSVLEENKELRALSLAKEERHKKEMALVLKEHETLIKDREMNYEKQLKAKDKNHLDELTLLRGTLKEFESSFTQEKQKVFEVSHTLGRCEEDLKKAEQLLASNEEKYIAKIEELSSSLADVNSQYNQLIGKVEVLEKS